MNFSGSASASASASPHPNWTHQPYGESELGIEVSLLYPLSTDSEKGMNQVLRIPVMLGFGVDFVNHQGSFSYEFPSSSNDVSLFSM